MKTGPTIEWGLSVETALTREGRVTSSHDDVDVGDRETHGVVAEAAGGSTPSGRAKASVV